MLRPSSAWYSTLAYWLSSSEWGEVAAIETVREAIGLFETIGMPSCNLSARTRAEYSRDLAE